MVDNSMKARIKSLEDENKELKEEVKELREALNYLEFLSVHEIRIRKNALKEAKRQREWEKIEKDMEFYFVVKPHIERLFLLFSNFNDLAKKQKVYHWAVEKHVMYRWEILKKVFFYFDCITNIKAIFTDEFEAWYEKDLKDNHKSIYLSLWKSAVKIMKEDFGELYNSNDEKFINEYMYEKVSEIFEERCRKFKYRIVC